MKPGQRIIDRIRLFNRYYTNVIGLLDRHYLATPFSLIEGRVLYEIAASGEPTAKTIRSTIDIDEGYLSRILDKFIRDGLIRKGPSAQDRRLQIIVLTEKGRRQFATLNENSNKSIARLIEKLSAAEQQELVRMMARIQELLTRQ